jgi:signal transduction histidine kinase/putative methionine-R-sulfoxide reductase with GAF domain
LQGVEEGKRMEATGGMTLRLAAWGIALCGLYLSSLYSFLLFHGLAELFSIVVACGIFVLAWNTRRLLQNQYLLFLGIASLFVASIDLIHTLSYKGMGVFPGYDANLPTQLWISARYMQSISLLLAPLFIKRAVHSRFTLAAYSLVTVLTLASIFRNIFPDCFIEGVGLTPFKRISEYLISGILGAAVMLLLRHRGAFEKHILQLLVWSILTTIVSEVVFTFYVSVYGFSNLVGHFAKIVAFFLIYKAIVETGLRRPYDLLFRNLKQSEERLSKARDELEIRVGERTAELARANAELRRENVQRQQAEEALRKVNRALKVLSSSNQALIHARDESGLLRDICRIVVAVGGYRLCWVGYAEEDEAKTVRPVAQRGDEDWYVDVVNLTWADTDRGRGPTGTAIRTGKPSVARDILTDPTYAPWRAEAARRGYASAIALPLAAGVKVLGALNIYAEEPDAFDAEEVRLLTELADDLAFGIASLRTRMEHGRAEDARQALYQASLEIHAPGRLEDRLKRLLKTAREVLRLDGVAIFLPEADGKWLQAAAALGIGEPFAPLRVPIESAGGGLANAYVTREAAVWDGAAPVPEPLQLKPPYDRIAALRARVFAIMPLLVQGRVVGVLGAHRKHSRQPFDPATLEMMQLFASHAAPAVEQARLDEELRRATIYLEARVEDRTRDLRRANQELQVASRHKSEFLANMSHELRTPLNSILGFAQILMEQTRETISAKQTRYLTNIFNSGQHLLQLINDILDLSKVEAGKFILQPESLPVAETLEDILVIARGLANKKGQTIHVESASKLPLLHADPVRFKQILFNLLSNAVKFTPNSGQITVRTRSVPGIADVGVQIAECPDKSEIGKLQSEMLEIAVTDTGSGINAEDLPRLFQNFVQLKATAIQHHEGTGLGLALTKRLVELHGGRIRAESPGEGQGSTFTVVLPFSRTGISPAS